MVWRLFSARPWMRSLRCASWLSCSRLLLLELCVSCAFWRTFSALWKVSRA
ncbi:hypothetical protein D3C85_1818270 [compost metagenome]